MFDNITNDNFLWLPYDEQRLGPNVVPSDIFTRADLWNAPSPIISFECIEWCPADSVMRQFGLAQGIPIEPRSLGDKHNECLTGRQLSSYPLFMNSVAPYLAERMEPHAFNTLYSLVNEFDMGQTNQTMPGHLSVDSHFHAPAGSAYSAARQYLILEDEEAARYTRYKDTDRSNSDDNDRDEEENYLVANGVDNDNETSQCAGDTSARAAGASTTKVAGKGYDLRTEHSRRNLNRFTPSGWSTKDLKKGASRVVKNVKNRFKKK
ncbi:hypothetical protein PIB30_003094 [Stylosanthes scabra]|uniref:Aminotransferase-like plant mobile domain-containing protein n=1 Tax=Stylosanthes scabra TaxID=79078 RepID=A0ABU6XZY7_9FABA|nr:hypothetical protein [Stylosanthes scabra]